LQALDERLEADLYVQITFSIRGEYPNPTYAHWLLRARCEGPNGSPAAEKRDDLAPSDVGHSFPLALATARAVGLPHV
jgi:hypothetical protein